MGDDAIRIARGAGRGQGGGLFQAILGARAAGGGALLGWNGRGLQGRHLGRAVAAMGASMMLNGVAQMLSQQRMLSVGDGPDNGASYNWPREHHGPGQSRAAAVWRNVRRQRQSPRASTRKTKHETTTASGKRRPRAPFLITRIGRPQGCGKGLAAAARPWKCDSLHSTAYARVIDLLGEGEIYRPVHGMDNALRDVYLNARRSPPTPTAR